MSSGATAQDQPWKSRDQGQEAQWAREQEKAQISNIREQMKQDVADQVNEDKFASKDFEGGFGGQEDLEDRYATTSGEH